ncbi:MAG: alpha/beta fold hydrolase [Candidatus Krumholzibacteriota bacterium]|nr:alpha/beta fold hydrolase [Candidatus Krumholzibacteriota bacterium]
MSKTLERINQSIWELQQRLGSVPDDLDLRKNLLKFFHESRVFVERNEGVPEKERSFLMMQEQEAGCCFLIHGAGGSPDEMRSIADNLFGQGYTVYGIRLSLDPGSIDSGFGGFFRNRIGSRKRRRNNGNHSRASSSWSVCLAESKIALETILTYSKSVFLVGLSFGGTIALNLMKKYKVKGTVLIAPALFPVKGRRYLFFKLSQMLLPSFVKQIAPVKTTMMELIDRTRFDIQPIDDPLLVVQAVDDPVVSQRGFNFLKRHSRNPRSKFVWIRDGGHLLVQGERAEEVLKICSDFIRDI